MAPNMFSPHGSKGPLYECPNLLHRHQLTYPQPTERRYPLYLCRRRCRLVVPSFQFIRTRATAPANAAANQSITYEKPRSSSVVDLSAPRTSRRVQMVFIETADDRSTPLSSLGLLQQGPTSRNHWPGWPELKVLDTRAQHPTSARRSNRHSCQSPPIMPRPISSRRS